VEEQAAHGVLLAEFQASLLCHGAQEGVGLGQQQAAAVAGLAVGRHRATVSESPEGGYSGFDEPMAGVTIHMGNQPETAVVSFEAGPVQAGCVFVRHGRLWDAAGSFFSGGGRPSGRGAPPVSITRRQKRDGSICTSPRGRKRRLPAVRHGVPLAFLHPRVSE